MNILSKLIADDIFLNEAEFICLQTVKWFSVLLFIAYASLNAFKYCCL